MKFTHPPLVAALLAALSLSTPAFAGISQAALPAGAQVVSGNPVVSAGGAQIALNGQNAVINWTGGFNVGTAATVNVNGQGAAGTYPALLNIDTSGKVSEIAGSVQANGASVFIANANGVIVDGTANLQAPNAVMGILGGTVQDTSQFSSAGTLTIGGQTAAPVTIGDGAQIGGGRVLIAGSGGVNIGAATIDATGVGAVLSGYPGTGVQLTATRQGKAGVSNVADYGVGAPATPQNLVIGAGAVLSGFQLIYSMGDITNNGVVQAVYAPGSSDAMANAGQINIAGGNITGTGKVVAQAVSFWNYGNINNPAGGGNAGNFWLSNRFEIDPFVASTPVWVAVNLQPGTQPQFINLWVNGFANYIATSPTIGTPAAGSHLVIQAAGTIQMVSMGSALTTPPGNTGGAEAFSFPGLIAAIAGSDGKGKIINPLASIIVNLGLIDNAISTAPPTGNGVFLLAGAQGRIWSPYASNGVTVITDPANVWVNTNLPVAGGLNVQVIQANAGGATVAAPADIQHTFNLPNS